MRRWERRSICRKPPRSWNRRRNRLTPRCTKGGKRRAMHLNKLTGMPNKAASFIGIDVGTQGCRTVLVSENGTIFSAQECAFPLSGASRQAQSPAAWWEACLATLRQLVHHARNVTYLYTIRAHSITSTSGTCIHLAD